MHAIVQSDEFGPAPGGGGLVSCRRSRHDSRPPDGYDEMQRVADATPYDGRVRYSGYGKGVLFWDVGCRGSSLRQQLPGHRPGRCLLLHRQRRLLTSRLAPGRWYPGIVETDHCHVASNYGWIIDRLEGLVSPPRSKPVWAVVELGHPFSESDWPTITPPQVRAAVWQSLIAGARGIIYFNHSFGGPDQTQHILRDGSRPAPSTHRFGLW